MLIDTIWILYHCDNDNINDTEIKMRKFWKGIMGCMLRPA